MKSESNHFTLTSNLQSCSPQSRESTEYWETSPLFSRVECEMEIWRSGQILLAIRPVRRLGSSGLKKIWNPH